VALAAVVALLFGLTACGSGGDDAGADTAEQTAGTTTAKAAVPPQGSSAEQQIEAVFASMKQAIADSDAQAVCGLMAAQPKEQVAKTVPQKSCEAGFQKVFDGGNVTEDLKPTFVSAEVSGDRAIVKAKPSNSKQLQEASFVEEGGKWKVNLWLTD
jgi:ketosteroid isomerase-like protein